MDNQQAMIEMIKATTGQANILTIPRPYIEFMGSLDGGLFLSQVIYWSDRGSQGSGWFYKTYIEWEKETTLSKYEVSKQVGILKKMGILKTKVQKANGAPTVHYHFSFSEFQKSFSEFLNYRKSSNLTMESEETERSLTETTTETTTEIKASSAKADSPIENSEISKSADGATTPTKTTVVKVVSTLRENEIRALKLPLSKWQEYLEEEQAGQARKGVIKFLESKVRVGPLLPDTQAAHLLFEKIAIECAACGHNPPTNFPSLATKEKFDQAAAQFNGTIDSVLDKAIHARGKGIKQIVDYISSPKWQNGGRNGSESANQGKQKATGNQGAKQQGPAAPVGDGQTPEIRRALAAAFRKKS